MKALLPLLLLNALLLYVPAYTEQSTFLALPITHLALCTNRQVNDGLSYKIINTAGNGYGYDIYRKQQLLIHQPAIPCVKGNKGFLKKEDAGKVALVVIAKIRKGIMPPALTVQELEGLHVLR